MSNGMKNNVEYQFIVLVLNRPLADRWGHNGIEIHDFLRYELEIVAPYRG